MRGMRCVAGALATLVVGAMAWAGPMAPAMAAEADPVADFYAGKTVQIVVGYSIGGGYDLYARTLSRYLGKHLPGHPNVVVQNMPGAGGLRAANYLAKAAPKDGTFLGTFARGLAMEPLLGRSEGVMFDALQFNWLGSITDEVSLCITGRQSGIATLADLRSKPGNYAGNGPGSDPDVFGAVLHNVFNMPVKVVAGFAGSSEAILSVERNEVTGFCGASWSELKSRHKRLLDDKVINLVVQMAMHKHADLPDVPLVIDLTSDPKTKAALELIFSRNIIARPFVAPPGLPAERVAALRQAFDATVADPEFLAETGKLQMEVKPVSGAEVEAMMKRLYATPPDVVKAAIEAVAASK